MRRFVVIGFLLALAAGCGRFGRPAATGPIELTEAPAADLEIALDTHKGKVVLVDFWAVWCPPCRARFPHFVDTHNKYAEKGLVCMSVSMDKLWARGAYDKAPVLAFLRDQAASLPNYVAMDGELRIGQRFGLRDGIPFKVLFDKTGRPVWDSERKHLSDRELDKLIESELAKP